MLSYLTDTGRTRVAEITNVFASTAAAYYHPTKVQREFQPSTM